MSKYTPKHIEQKAKPERRPAPAPRPARRERTARPAGGNGAVRPAGKAFCLLGLPLTAAALELLLRAASAMPVMHEGLAGGLFAAVALSLLLSAICALPRKGAAACTLRIVCAELLTIWFIAAFFINDTYFVFMQPSIVLNVAGDAVKDFGGNIVNVFVNGLPMILLFHIPVVLLIILHRPLKAVLPLRVSGLLLAAALLFGAGSYGLSTYTPALREKFKNEYTYDGAVRNFGLISAMGQELSGFGRHGSDNALTLYPPKQNSSETAMPEETASTQVTETESDAPSEVPEEKEYGYNIMELDFEKANPSGNSALDTLRDYVLSLEPSRKNEYTGIFEGKNLILITAEAFSKEIIDEQRTPTLYRLANKGIVFEDFYQPVWGGSTSTGEYSWLTGIAPTNAMAMMTSPSRNLYFTMGNQLQRQGYHSAAYHDGNYTYYSRNQTHTNLGYAEFIGIGNGLEEGMSGGFPASDLEMIDFTVPQYISQQPFSIYYMTISGHASYAFSYDVNDMSMKNKAITDDMPYSNTVKAYYACNQELEYALESLLSQLEQAGILNDTVIAMVPDHYPYGLMPSSAWGSKNTSLTELYGYPADTNPSRDHNAAIIWCGSLEALDEPIVVSDPVTSLDILPTLSNLFGLEFDSRLLVGRDVLADTQPLVFWTDYSWLTEKGYYDSHERAFTPAEGEEMPDDDYIELMKNTVSAKISFSRQVDDLDYYGRLFG